jgi:hypothetical protein
MNALEKLHILDFEEAEGAEITMAAGIDRREFPRYTQRFICTFPKKRYGVGSLGDHIR